MNSNALKASTAALLTATAATALANPGTLPANLHPRAYCALAKDSGLPSRKPYSEASGTCGSDRQQVTPTPGVAGLRQLGVFYAVLGATDNPRTLDRLSLVLNVNNVKEGDAAKKALAQYAEQLGHPRLWGDPTTDLASAVIQGKPKSWRLPAWHVEVAREDFENKKGIHPLRASNPRANNNKVRDRFSMPAAGSPRPCESLTEHNCTCPLPNRRPSWSWTPTASFACFFTTAPSVGRYFRGL